MTDFQINDRLIAHVAANGLGWCILSERGARGWHSIHATYQDAREHFDAITTPIIAVDL